MEYPTTSIIPTDLHPRDAYRLFISIIAPRPIAWVSSLGADGTLNLAPFSFFNGVGGTPPTVMISVGQRAGVPKDTLRNVQETGEFVVHIVERVLAEKMNLTAGEYEYGVDEFALAGLEYIPSVDVKPPRLVLASVAMEVKATQFVPVQDTHYTMILGQVLRYHIRDGLIRPNGLIDPLKIHPVARLGGDEYTDVDHIFTLTRPQV
jgi:flavin reductase (DIM6/NTAB) family NADH-FMN oxidoreductase RutF